MSNEWYTPAKYIEAARSVMGSIDLDPASCALANQTVRAARYYTQEDDGLSKAWYGNVWLNPPYSTPATARGWTGGKRAGLTAYWLEKLLSEYDKGNINQAIACLNADTCRSWFQPLWEFPICFAEKAIAFERLGEAPEHHFFGSIFVYLGAKEQRFIDVFSQFGRIAKAIDVPVAKPRQLELIA